MNTENLSNPAPEAVAADARNRALRTFVQGLGIDLLAAVCIVLLPAVSSIEWTSAYWLALGASVARSLVQALVSYVARFVVPPADEGDEVPA